MTSDFPTLWAIGDVHGEAARLARLHASLFERQEKAGAPHITLVHLGDYVDRGPDSAGVIALVRALYGNPGVTSVALKGNHEEMLCGALLDRKAAIMDVWLANGGDVALESYQSAGGDAQLLDDARWLESLPDFYCVDERRIGFVHAGIDPETFPDTPERVCRWTRSRKFFDLSNWHNPALAGWTIVHGHTPTRTGYPEEVRHFPHMRRINIDSGAVYGGRLTAVGLRDDGELMYLYA